MSMTSLPDDDYRGGDAEDDRRAIIRLVNDWVVFRDAGYWDRFAGVWHHDGRMHATWFQGPATEFIAASRAGRKAGVNILHTICGISVDIAGDRAIAQTKMVINQRADVHGVRCDVECFGRFYDFLERRDGRWGIVLRQPIYEKDRILSVVPGAAIQLDESILQGFPVGYQHLAYVQTQVGMTVVRDMPGLDGDAVEELYRRGASWLNGGPSGG